MKISRFIISTIVLLLFSGNLFSQSLNEADYTSSDYISEETVASVVKLSSLLCIYTVDGLSDDYEYKTINGEPDFGNAKIISAEDVLVHVGTGVIVTSSGLILTNAHVYGAYLEPEIHVKTNPAGKVMKGKSGESIKQVVINQYPYHMFVGMCDVENLKKNDYHQRLAYIAEKVVWDSDYNSSSRDRAILQIVNESELGKDGLPVIGEKCMDKLNLPYSKLANPFEHGYLETKVRAVGFPGVGDPNRSSKTSGEMLGYEDDNHSNILHTSWISNGNSGGGLFYNNNLIGINTWDNRMNASRPVAIAQPNTYWDEFFAYTKYVFPSVPLPDYSYDWVEADPSTEKYKNEAYVLIQLVYKVNASKPVGGGRLLVFDDSFTREELEEYIDYEQDFNTIWTIIKLLWEYEVDEVLEIYDIERDFANNLKNVTSDKDFRELLNDNPACYYDLWCSNRFVYDIYSIPSTGKIMLSVPKNTNLKLIYIDDDDNESQVYSLKINDKNEQGPFGIRIGE